MKGGRGIGGGGFGAPLALAALGLLAGCDGPEYGPGGWRYTAYRHGDSGPSPQAHIGEIGGPGELTLFCTGAFGATFHGGRDRHGEAAPARLLYRIDDGAPVLVVAEGNGESAWLAPRMRPGGTPVDMMDDPIVPPLENARRLVVAIAPANRVAYGMTFDVTHAREALAWLRARCDEPGR